MGRLGRSWPWLALCLASETAHAEPPAPREPSAPTVSVPKPLDAKQRAYLDELVVRARELRLSERNMWWRLLHYEASLLGPVSQADGELFFNAPNGKTDPEAELEATIVSLFGPAPRDARAQHPFCRFPARLAWLSAELEFDYAILPKQTCPALEDFRETTHVESLTLIFSSYYLNTPASAFGHSFLRLNKHTEDRRSERQELLDYGIDYSATVDTGNAVLYAIKGLAGLFPGNFSKRPYYYKVREYNDYEARDLWEFDLELTQNEVDMAVAHIWELGSTYFSYYYLTENCSYHMLGILEVARPSLDLKSHLGWPVVPVDTVRALLHTRGLVNHVAYRPSVRSQFRYGLAGLTDEEVDSVFELGENVDAPLPAHFSLAQQVKVLDVALDLIDVRYAKDLLDRTSEGARLRQRLSTRRALTRKTSRPADAPPPPSGHPASGHGTKRVSLGTGYASDSGPYHALSFRLALHDLTDPARAYPQELAINFLPTELRYRIDAPSVSVESFALVDLASLSPRDRFDDPLSWNFRFGAARIRDQGCLDCLAGIVEVGGGRAWALSESRFLFFLHLNNRVMGLAPIEGGIADLPLRAGLGPLSGVRIAPRDDLTFVLSGDAIYLPVQTPYFMWSGRGSLRYEYVPGFTFSAQGSIQEAGWSAEVASSIYY